MTITVNITGPQGSGKTLLAEWLRANMPSALRRPQSSQVVRLPIVDIVDGEQSPTADAPPVSADEVAAQQVKDATDALNAAVVAAHRLGLRVKIDTVVLDRTSIFESLPNPNVLTVRATVSKEL